MIGKALSALGIGLLIIAQTPEGIPEENNYANLPQPVPIEETVAPSITDAERNLVERVVAAEARGESLLGQMAVAQVIKDRSELWGKSITETVTAKGQFAAPYYGEIPEVTKQAVWEIFDNQNRAVEGPITHFYNPALCSPSWAASKTVMAQIGNHVFLY